MCCGPFARCADNTLLYFVLLAACLFVAGIIFGMSVLETEAGETENSALASLVRTSSRLRQRIVAEEHGMQDVLRPPSAGQFDGVHRGGQGGQQVLPSPAAPQPAQPASSQAPPALEPAPQTQPVTASPPDLQMTFHGSTTQALRFDPAADSADISFGVWIYLPSATFANQRTIKTLASTRAAGCFDDVEHNGYTFYVNEWETANRQLRLEWSSSNPAGCVVLASDAGAVPLDKWVHVAFAFEAGTAQRAMLFIDGQLVKQTDAKGRHVQQGSTGLHIGQTTDGQYPFAGRMAYAFVTKTVISPTQLQHAMSHTTLAGFKDLTKMAAKQLTAALVFADSGVPGASKAGLKVVELTNSLKAASNGAGAGGAVPMGNMDPIEVQAAKGDSSPAVQGGPYTPVPVENLKGADNFDFSSGGNQWLPRLLKLDQELVTGTVQDKASLAAGSFDDSVSAEEMAASDAAARPRAAEVREAMEFVWKGYKEKAWGADELKPKSGSRVNNWGGMGMTLIDALDTLWLMGMRDEFNDAVAWIKEHLSFDAQRPVSVFETTIRALGGLLSAYDLSGERVLLEKAQDLGDRLLPAFNTPTGIPKGQVNLHSGAAASLGWTGSSSVLAELGTLQVEFRFLSRATGDPKYARAVERVMEHMATLKPADGLFPVYVSPQTGQPSSRQVTFGALGDSFYEYLVKVWIQGGKQEGMYRSMYDTAMNGMTGKMLQKSSPSKLMYVAEWNGNSPIHKMDHLACFVPGMLALGAYTAANGAGSGTSNVQRDLQNAKALAYTCHQMYDRQATGLSPEFVEFKAGQDLVVPPRGPWYLLRPEAAESMFILHQLTGNPIYREWGWKMFTAIRDFTKTTYGFGQHPDVRDTGRQPDDKMESFFLAETLKYLYLLQAPDHPIKLTEFVFNTEAHPTRVFSKPAGRRV